MFPDPGKTLFPLETWLSSPRIHREKYLTYQKSQLERAVVIFNEKFLVTCTLWKIKTHIFPLSVRGNWLKMENVPPKASRFALQACLQNLGNFQWKENISNFFFMFKKLFSSKTINVFQLFLYINSKHKAIVQWQNYIISAFASGFCMWQRVNKQLWQRNEMELLNETTLTDTHVYSFFSLFQMNANKSHLRFFFVSS